MFLLSEPSSSFICKFLSAQEGESYSYTEIGATRTQPPFGYTLDHNRTELGVGQDIFDRAVAALKTWRQFELGWVRILPQGVPIEVGATVAILTRHFGFWSLNAARIVYVIDEEGPLQKYGFAYGTLSEHAECGEERFTIEWQPDGLVWYDILAFSRSNQLLVKLGSPLARRLQKRFARDSLAAMTRVCREE